jgi:hypothetical protein
VATEAVGSVEPPPLVAVNNSRGEWVGVETVDAQIVSEPQVVTGSGDDDVMMVPTEQIAPPPLPAGDHEAVTPAATETPVVVMMPAVRGVAAAPAFRNWSTINLGVINLDAIEHPSNDRDIFEAMLERVLADPKESGVEVPGAATSSVAASTDAGASSSGALMPGTAATE